MDRIERLKQYWENAPKTMHGQMGLDHLTGTADADELVQLAVPEVLTYLPPLENAAILDLPAGLGRFTGEFATRAERVVAADLLSTHIELNKLRNAHHSNIEYICQNALDLTSPPAQFDLIFISWLFTYLEDSEIEALVPRLVSWLKPGGHLFFKESCSPTRTRNERNKSGYFAIYRTLAEYPRFFKQKLSLIQEGNLFCYERCLADPFKCYWLFRKREL